MHNIQAYVLLCNEGNITIYCKFPQIHSYQILLKLVNIWHGYSENKKGELFFETQCSCTAVNAMFSEVYDQWVSGERRVELTRCLCAVAELLVSFLCWRFVVRFNAQHGTVSFIDCHKPTAASTSSSTGTTPTPHNYVIRHRVELRRGQ